MFVTNKIVDKLNKRNETAGQKISICIPTHPKSNSQNINQDTTRYKNALQDIEESDLLEKNMKNTMKKLKDKVEDTLFWQHQRLSLVVYADKDNLEFLKLPVEIDGFNVVSDKFVLSPLVLTHDLQLSCFLLDLNIKKPKLYLADTQDIDPINSLEIKAWDEIIDEDFHKRQQFHTGGGKGGSTPMYHGQGGSDDIKQEYVEFYFKHIAASINDFLADKQLQLVLAGDANRINHFKKFLDYKHINDKILKINRSQEDLHDLHKDLRSMLVEMSKKDLAINGSELKETPDRAKVSGNKSIKQEIEKGAVDTLFVPRLRFTSDSVRSGYGEEMLIDFEDIDDLDELVMGTRNQGGAIKLLESEDGKEDLVAKLRF